jgi:NAD(P)-dependent dehydrogenase (short-subunit alcohol dehydrogenase family)
LSNGAGPVALVTGAGAGIGRACVFALSESGFTVVANDIDADACDKTVALAGDAGGSACAAVFDVSDEDSWRSTVLEVLRDLGPIAVLVNNAALKASTEPGDGGVLDMLLPTWDRILTVNLRGPMLGARAVLPSMLERGHGSIVMMSSISSVRSVPGLATAYTVAKAGLDGLTRTIAVTYGPGGIRCNALAPGLILADDMPPGPSSTSLSGQGLIREDGRTADVASVVSFLASDRSKFINGQTILVDGGISANLAGVTSRNRAGDT